MLIAQGIKITDGTLIWFSDASHMDCDEGRSTCCHIGFFQGGVIDAASFVPQPIPHSTAESETMAIGPGAMACAYARKAIADILFDDPDRPWTVPFISDSQAAIAMNNNERPTRRNKHIDSRYFYGRQERQRSRIEFHYLDTKFSIADIGTKNLPWEESANKLKILEYPVTDSAIGKKAAAESPERQLEAIYQSKKGDGNTVSPGAGNATN